MSPKVSVMVVTYNQVAYLKECLDSVLAQDYDNLEIVVADDASSDGTQDALRAYAAQNPGKFTLVLAERNRGITINFNCGFFACQGEYIAIMGGDDVMLPGKISKQVAVLEADQTASMCVTAADVFQSETNATLYIHPCTVDSRKEYGPREIISADNCVLGSTALVRRSMCPSEGFDARVPVVSDYLFYVECAVRGPVKVLEEVLWRYRRHGNNTMNGKFQDRIDISLTYAILEYKYPFLLPEIRAARSRHAYLRALHFFNRGDIQTARTLMTSAFADRKSLKTGVWQLILRLPDGLRGTARQRWLARIGEPRQEGA